MPRFYVKNKQDKWNIYSSVVDDLLFDDFMSFDELKKYVCSDAYNEKAKEMDTLLTDKKELNYLDTSLLPAINKQIEELGWND